MFTFSHGLRHAFGIIELGAFGSVCVDHLSHLRSTCPISVRAYALTASISICVLSTKQTLGWIVGFSPARHCSSAENASHIGAPLDSGCL